MDRLGTEKKIAPYAAQFVPVKLNINSKEYRVWSTDLKKTSKGTGVPYIYVVRSDGETLYGGGGALPGDKLGMMLASTLQNSGRVLSAKEVDTLGAIVERYESSVEAGDIAGAVKALNKTGRMGAPGQIASYAKAASKVNELASTAATEVVAKLEELNGSIESGETSDQLTAVLASQKLESDYGGLKILKPEFSKFEKTIGKNKEITQLVKEAKIISAASSASSKTAKQRALEKLQALIDSTQIDEVKTKAKSVLEELSSS